MIIDKNNLDIIIKYVKAGYPKEACGILAGKDNKIFKVYNMINTSEQPEICYFMDAKEQFKVMKEIRNENLEMVAIYHSHTNSQAYPSKKDLELAFYPDSYYVIISLSNFDNPEIKAFKINGSDINKEALTIEE